VTHVRLQISDRLAVPEGLIGMLGGTEVARHHVNDAYGGYTTIIVDMPGAPAHAHTMTPIFTKHDDGRVALASIEYTSAGGDRIQIQRRP